MFHFIYQIKFNFILIKNIEFLYAIWCDTTNYNLLTMKLKQAKEIESKCIEYVAKLCINVAPDHGLEHAVFVGNLARVGLSDFPEITTRQALLVMLAALMHDLDDAKIFKTENYENANTFLKTVRLRKRDKRLVIKMISLVSYSQNKNEIPALMPRWVLIPRDADRIAGGGQEGLDRTVEYNARLPVPRPLVTKKDVALFDKFPVSREDVRAKFDSSATKQSSLFEFYITNWHNRGVCASGSKQLQVIFEREYGILLDYWVGAINSAKL